MTELSRVRVAITGFEGSPGVATHYFLDLTTAIASLHTAWTEWSHFMPGGVRVNIESAGDLINDTNGAITGGWQGDPTAAIVSRGTGPYASPVGMQIKWSTKTIVDGKRLRGRTFVVPMAADVFDAAGRIAPLITTPAATAAAAFLLEQSASFVVWHRPKFGPKPVGGGARPLIRPGGHGLVTGGAVPSQSVVLRSRRD